MQTLIVFIVIPLLVYIICDLIALRSLSNKPVSKLLSVAAIVNVVFFGVVGPAQELVHQFIAPNTHGLISNIIFVLIVIGALYLKLAMVHKLVGGLPTLQLRRRFALSLIASMVISFVLFAVLSPRVGLLKWPEKQEMTG